MTRAPLRPAARKARRLSASALRRRHSETPERAALSSAEAQDDSADSDEPALLTHTDPAPADSAQTGTVHTEPDHAADEVDGSATPSHDEETATVGVLPENEALSAEESSADTDEAAAEETPEHALTGPVEDENEKKDEEKDAEKKAEENAEASSDTDDDDGNSAADDFKGMSLREHLVELRTRLLRAAICVVVGFFACFGFAKTIYSFLTAPLESVLPADSFMIFTGLPEGFLVEVRVAFFAAIFLTSPLIFYQIWSFVAPGLYKEERRFVLPVALASAVFFICGALFCYFFVFPIAFEFFMSYSTGKIKAAPSVAQYLSFVTQLLLAFGLVFELPLFCFFLGRLGILKAAHLRRWRPYSVLGCVILAALLTPPDVYSQLLMVGPLLLLYEVSILIVAFFGKKDKKKKDEKDETEPEAEAEADTEKPSA